MRLHRVRVDAIIQLRQRAVEIPRERQAAVFVLLEPLEFLDEIQPKLDRNPRSELKRDVLVRVSAAAVAASSGNQTNGPGGLNPALGRQDKTVQSSLLFNPIEFDGIKTGVVQPFPNAEELNGVPISQPVLDEVIRPFAVLVASDVRKSFVHLPVDA